MAREPDYYEILQVHPEAEHEVIEAAYRRLARKYHPDVNKHRDAAERMRLLNEAFEVLNDPIKRAEYDARRGFSKRYQQPAWEQAEAGAPPAPRPVVPPGRSGWFWAIPAVIFVIGVVISFGVASFLMNSEGNQSESSGSSFRSVTASASPALEPIDVRRVLSSIEERHSSRYFNFGAWEYVELTGDDLDELLVRWNQGGNCGYHAEVWGYYRGELTNLTPETGGELPNDLGCGSIEAKDVLGLGRPQIVSKARTYTRPGILSDVYSNDIYCWNGGIFVHVATDYEDFDGEPVRPRLTILESSECQ